jgi:hypothetical protein
MQIGRNIVFVSSSDLKLLAVLVVECVNSKP